MIQTTQRKAIQAYKVIEKISNGSLPLPVSYRLFKLKKILGTQYEFQITKENELFDTYQPEPQGSSWVFKSEEDKNAFVKKMKEINDLEIELDCDVLSIPLDTNLSLSIEDMEALDEYVTFE